MSPRACSRRPGRSAGAAPRAEDAEDIAFGARLLEALSPFDVGQGAVIAAGRALAVEAAEGTDAMLARVADLRASGRLRFKGRGGRSREGAEARAGPPARPARRRRATIEAAAQRATARLALAAGRVLIADRDATIAAAERAGLFVRVSAHERRRGR